jgi:hypothetical protein
MEPEQIQPEIMQKRSPFILVISILVIVVGVLFFLTQNKNDAWSVFTAYLKAAEANDIQELSRYSHKISSVCQGEEVNEECGARMNAAYTIGSQFKEGEFKNRVEDHKQLILSTDGVVYEDEQEVGYSKKYLLFTKNEEGDLKVLGMDPSRRYFVYKKVGSTTEELLPLAEREMVDSDMDGAPDRFEECNLPLTILVESCEKTDPQNRDTDGDGWWDGVEPFLLTR